MSLLPLLSPAERSYIRTGLADPKTPTRLDNRKLDGFRSVQISQGDAPQANGSSRVVLGGKGGTEVMVGIKLEVVDAAEIGEEADEERQGKESWRASVEVDVLVEPRDVNLFSGTYLTREYSNPTEHPKHILTFNLKGSTRCRHTLST